LECKKIIDQEKVFRDLFFVLILSASFIKLNLLAKTKKSFTLYKSEFYSSAQFQNENQRIALIEAIGDFYVRRKYKA